MKMQSERERERNMDRNSNICELLEAWASLNMKYVTNYKIAQQLMKIGGICVAKWTIPNN